MKISVIIPVYNEENFILKTLEKVNEQKKNFELEIIVVDDKSKDGTVEKIKNNYALYDLLIENDINQGKGAAIKVMDSSTICDYRMVSYMKEVSERHNIPHQLEILTGGGTDTAGIQRFTPGGSIAGAVSIPTRHIHQVIEMADKTDIRNAIDLLHYSVKELDQYDWSFKQKKPCIAARP